MIPGQSIWGIGEIADVYGVSVPAVRKWRLHEDWPEPCAVIGKQLVWSADEIRAWVGEYRSAHAIGWASPRTEAKSESARRDEPALALADPRRRLA